MITYYCDEDEPAWKHAVAKELNTIICRTAFVSSDPNMVDLDREFVKAAESICARVAEFEGIKSE